MAEINAKRGDSFVMSCTRKTTAGAAFDLTGYSIACRVATSDATFTEDLSVSITDAVAGEFSVSQTPANTASWPVGTLKTDIEFTLGTLVESTKTFDVVVLEDITP